MGLCSETCISIPTPRGHAMKETSFLVDLISMILGIRYIIIVNKTIACQSIVHKQTPLNDGGIL